MKVFQKGLLLALLTFLVVLGVILFINVDFSNSESLDVFIQSKIAKAEIPGASCLLIRARKVVSIHHAGYSNVEKKKRDFRRYTISSCIGIQNSYWCCPNATL